jgi:hypothetical protein
VFADCECPPWIIDPAPPCGWNEDGTLADIFSNEPTLTCTMSDVQTLANTTTRDATLVNAFGKRGCQ